jgi:Trk-type K+ transport system membrane component
MIPFNGSFLLIYVLNVVMLAGNHALPMMLRFYIWLGTKLWRRGQVNETLHFLLDHPRRYVLVLFHLLLTYPPSWLLICLVTKSTVDAKDR